MSELDIPVRDDDHDEQDWEQRVLCPDELCIGTIGADGRCRMCGEVSPDGPPRERGDTPTAAGHDVETLAADDEDHLDEHDRDDDAGIEADADRDADDDWDERELCPDDMCVGTLGPDGRCRMCGQTAPDSAPQPALDAEEIAPDTEATADDEPDDEASGRCPDNTCTFDPFGHCTVCGTARS